MNIKEERRFQLRLAKHQLNIGIQIAFGMSLMGTALGILIAIQSAWGQLEPDKMTPEDWEKFASHVTFLARVFYALFLPGIGLIIYAAIWGNRQFKKEDEEIRKLPSS